MSEHCCAARRVNYVVPNPCQMQPTINEVPAPLLSFILESNTSGRNVQSGAVSPVPIGGALPFLSDGDFAQQIGMLVACGGGVQNFANTISIVGTLATNDRRMIGIGNWSNYGGILDDADGLSYDSAEVYAGGILLHTQSDLPDINGGQFHETLFPSALLSPTSIRMWAGRKAFNGSVHANSREVAPVWAWRGRLRWACQLTVEATIDPVDPFAGPLRQQGGAAQGGMTMTRGGLVTFANGNLTQTFGPHVFTFNVPAGVVGTVTTNRPGNFSNLTLTPENPSFVLSGNQTQTFAVSWAFTEDGCRPGVARDGSIFDLATGVEINDPELCG